MIAVESLTIGKLKRLAPEDLPGLADQIRHYLIHQIATTGGHIGANLGTIELSIAMHYVFDSPSDAIVWDTGHQGYTHKLLTGRASMFPSLNTFGGMNRFVSSSESEHDIIEASHAGTSISVALGIALARRLEKKSAWALAVIGDGALCEGIALEALNHAAVETDIRMAVILNDNGYAISPGFGGLHNYLQSRQLGQDTNDTLFSSLGYNVIGPVDGHDTSALIEAFNKVKQTDVVSLVHVKTEKGRGYAPASSHPFKMHFSFPYETDSGMAKPGLAARSYQDVAAKVIGQQMDENPSITAITPSTLYATGMSEIFTRHRDRCFDPGMEEQHALTLTLGLAKGGLTPVIFYQSTFMQRAFDQLFHDVCYAGLPVLILVVRSGFAGYDNPTHHGIYDLSYLRCLPGLKIFYPKDAFELEAMTMRHLRHLEGPTMILMPYGPVDELDDSVLSISNEQLDAPEVLDHGKDLLVIAVGNKFAAARQAVKLLEEDKHIACTLVNLRRIKPLPDAELTPLLKAHKRVVTVEENVLEGGMGSSVASLMADRRILSELFRIGLDCVFVSPGSNQELCETYHLDGTGIARQIMDRWNLK